MTVDLSQPTGTILIYPVASTSATPCYHSGQYDTFSKTLITWGNNHICQTTVSPVDGTFTTSNIEVVTVSSGNPQFDQGTVDGLGNLFIGDNNGHLWYNLYKNAPNHRIALGVQGYGVTASQFDDVAPLIGGGSTC